MSDLSFKNLTMIFFYLFILSVLFLWDVKGLGTWTRNVIEGYYKQNSVGHPSKCLEDSSAENSTDCGDQLRRFPRGTINKWAQFLVTF